jgi:hypothetical protein
MARRDGAGRLRSTLCLQKYKLQFFAISFGVRAAHLTSKRPLDEIASKKRRPLRLANLRKLC